MAVNLLKMRTIGVNGAGGWWIILANLRMIAMTQNWELTGLSQEGRAGHIAAMLP